MKFVWNSNLTLVSYVHAMKNKQLFAYGFVCGSVFFGFFVSRKMEGDE